MADIWEEYAEERRQEAERYDNDPAVQARRAAQVRREIERGLRDADGYLIGFDGPEEEEEDDGEEDED